MKNHLQQKFRQHRGSAIIFVLFGCVLCALMVVILMERVAVSSKSTAAYTQSAQLRSFSDMALNYVQAQIRDATTDGQKTSTPLAQRNTWASQPGAIRTYTIDGNLQSIYKLYSSTSGTTTDPDLGNDVPANWYSRKTEYTDLNEPVRLVKSGTTEIHYPIISGSFTTVGGTTTLSGTYGTGIANGFNIVSAPVDTGDPEANKAPMPVHWIYVLEDGTRCQLGDSRINRTTNPIVGRIAFWTDDETAKVNINTASASGTNSYWDVPKTTVTHGFGAGSATYVEDAYEMKQPAQNEYQRYSGHPATVSLKSILGDLQLSGSDYFNLCPYYTWGGSQDGTVNYQNSSALPNKKDRAYVTLDELLFASGTSTLRIQPAPAQVESLRFFLTSNSRAPELNLFGQPRVTIWPISNVDDSNHRTPFDKLIAFDSTIGNKKYYFSRFFPLDPTRDFTDSTMWRNRDIYAYLQTLTSTKVPGFGGSDFLAKYGGTTGDRDQILTEIFDYIRAGVNLNETYAGRPANFESYTPAMSGTLDRTISYSGTSASRGAGFVVPIQIGNTRGGGRFPAVTNVGIQFVHHRAGAVVSGTWTADPDTTKTGLQACLHVQTCTPMHGYMPWIGKDLQFRISNSTLQVTSGTSTMNLFTGGTTGMIYYPPAWTYGCQSPGGYDGYRWTMGFGNNYFGPAQITPRSAMMSPDMALGADATTFSLTAGSVDISLLVNGTTIQTYRANFPALTSHPLPGIFDDFAPHTADGAHYYLSGGHDNHYPWWTGRFADRTGHVRQVDVLKSVNLSHGDARLALMANTTGPGANLYQDFAALPNYSTAQFSHCLGGVMAGGWGGYIMCDGTTGKYVNLPYSSTYTYPWLVNGLPPSGVSPYWVTNRPMISSTITDLRASGWSGDFDNGIGNFSDGPFLNKPDEGDTIPLNYSFAYFDWQWVLANGFFSPLRQIPSAAMFGSLPTGVKASIPWRTLLFCPNPANPNHIGFQSPPDYLLLDLFRMPVVEPLAISGPASTDGKINMNYAIAPFSYIKRKGSWYALLEVLKFLTIPNAQSTLYKNSSKLVPTAPLRSSVNISETLKQFDNRFDNSHDIFRSAAEICSIFLVPQDGSTKLADVQNLDSGYWSTHRLTGDNSREKPYADLYGKLTTQSNTFRVHMRAQILPKSAGPPSRGGDFVPLAEYRGSRLIERYIDPKDSRFSNVDPDTSNLNELYQFRVLEASQFSP